MPDLSNKVALITGASSGIGGETAVHFASLGCWLALTGRDQAALDKVATLCQSKGLPQEKVLVISGDLCKEDDVANVVKKTLEHFGKLDILVNSAGIIKNGTTEATPLAVYDQVMNINLRSVFHVMQVAIPHLRKTKGNIVNVSSVTGLRAFPGVVVYNISKAGLDQLTRTAALELAADGIRVNAVNPGVIITEVHKRAGMSEEDYAKFLEHCKTTHAMGRVGTADEVARTIAFLASEDASFITGQTLAIDGGRSIMCPR
ncbi:3-oxoacyl-[acyl-carrier-protein] reductase FabG [Ixodes scapularis]|uniref:3-oxoacyl-[acyl-carrier-protein] reductase FabG n=1 Tax=Ixodes scapularis TaxID=6945 RepID=UPI001C37F13F|nr:3-oxoacyl-[acyl-carrier-protein] reductase FabG [Ixodes scapularis]